VLIVGDDEHAGADDAVGGRHWVRADGCTGSAGGGAEGGWAQSRATVEPVGGRLCLGGRHDERPRGPWGSRRRVVAFLAGAQG
jgi:hypothetical protein